MSRRRDGQRLGVPALDWAVFAHLLTLAAEGAALSAARSKMTYPSEGFAKVMLWALRDVDGSQYEVFDLLIETYAQKLRDLRPDLSFGEVLQGLRFAASVSQELDIDEELRLSACLERFARFNQ